ncbi:hypothetical protein MBRA_03859 [Methylobacterium brachiatum]|nr:hypothetical protein MBRA_03859 [Methylobacterium brachiatum]
MAILAVAAASSLRLVDDISQRRLADGELDAGTAARVRARLGRDPEMTSRFAGLAEVRALLSSAPGQGAMPVPNRLKASILKANEAARPGAERRAFGIIDCS